MNKYLFFAIALFLSVGLSAQKQNFEQTMQSKISKIEGLKSADDYTTLARDFAELGGKDNTQWLPYYYAAYLTVMKGQMLVEKGESQNLDMITGEAEKYLWMADLLSPNNAEIYIVRVMNDELRLLTKPEERSNNSSKKGINALEAVKKLDNNNPRLFIVQALHYFNTGNKAEAKRYFEMALPLFKNQKNQSAIAPNWGEEMAQQYISKL